jgi:hypothetical protein
VHPQRLLEDAEYIARVGIVPSGMQGDESALALNSSRIAALPRNDAMAE